MREEIIGGQRLICGDCLEVLPTLEAGSVDAVVTDPPYGINKAEWDDAVPVEALSDCKRVMIDGGSMYWFGVPPFVWAVFPASGLDFQRELYWWFDTGFPCANNYRMATETILFLSKGAVRYFDADAIREQYRDKAGGGRKHNPLGKSPGNVIYCPRPAFGHASENEHPTAKPLWLMDRLVAASVPPSGVALDPFMGSGTTLVAAELLGRRGIGIELSPEYFDIACRRVEKAVRDREQAEAQLTLAEGIA